MLGRSPRQDARQRVTPEFRFLERQARGERRDMASAAASGNHVAFRAVRQLLAAGLHLGIAPLFSAPRRLERVALQTWPGGCDVWIVLTPLETIKLE